MPSVIEGAALESGWFQALGHFLMRELSLSWSVLKATGRGHTAVVLEQGLASRSWSWGWHPGLFPCTKSSCKPSCSSAEAKGSALCSSLSLSLSFFLPQLFLFAFPPLPLAHLLLSIAYQIPHPTIKTLGQRREQPWH